MIESGRSSGLKGKTPEATLAAMLAVGSRPGGSFKRVDKATYTLAHDLVSRRLPSRTSRGAPSNLGPMSSRSSLMLLTVNGTAQSYWRHSGLLDARKSSAARPSAEMWWADSSATAQPRLWLTTSTLCPSGSSMNAP